MTIKVWTSHAEAGRLGRQPPRGSAFVYAPDVPPERAVSLTMPVRLASWDTPYGLAPIFEMNLPEGVLRERLRLAFAKATGSFDDLDLLTLVGRSQVGRLRFTGEGDDLDEAVPFQSVDEILAAKRDSGLFAYLLERFATFSGISGVQPKLLLRDHDAIAAVGPEDRASLRGATHIVKFWEPEYPELAANEYFCLRAAERAGLEVPRFQLAEDGRALVVDRFDLRADGAYRGFEDFCVLNARAAADKYRGSYETQVLKRFRDFASGDVVARDSERLFALIALNCALRNGDAHLKNFGVVYDELDGPVSLAPVYDLVTTTVYLPADAMALTLDGTTRWPDSSRLRRFGEARGVGGPAAVRAILARIAEALAETAIELKAHMAARPAFADVGGRMLAEWSHGAAESLGISRRFV
jgi:serine/threonine-protein kinase HipA